MGKKDNYLSAKVPNSLKRKVPKLRYFWAILQFPMHKSSLHEMGWFRSAWKESSVSKNGNPIPWITYAAIYFLENKINKGHSVYEYGSGNSTLWWAKKAKSVISVENDKFWQQKVSKTLPKNAQVIFRPLGKEYSNSISEQKNNFDIVIVDGRQRVDCALASVNKLNNKGIIVWDNSDRDRYKSGIQKIEKKGFKRIDFYGPAPIDNMAAVTSVFYREDNILNI